MTFANSTAEAVKAFLQTVVVVDDYPADETAEVPDALVLPLGVERPIVGGGAPSLLPPTVATSIGRESPSHSLRGNVLQRAFADVGLICSVLFASTEDAQEEDRWLTRVRTLGAKSDVMILDWSWRGDNGKFCTKLIGSLVSDASPRRQLIIIYTAEPTRDTFGSMLKVHNPERKNNFNFEWADRGISVVVVQKPGADGKAFYANSKVAEEALPTRVLELFAQKSGGLLANPAMHALGQLRDLTHRILYRFRPELDAPFVAHRAYSVPRDSADEQVLDLLLDSISDSLSAFDLSAYLSDSAMEMWLRADAQRARRVETDLTFLAQSQVFSIASGFAGNPPPPLAEPAERSATVGELVAPAGLAASVPAYDAQMEQITQAIMGGSLKEAVAKLKEFSAFIYCAQEPLRSGPKLANGVLIEEVTTGRLLLCVIPRCDAERIAATGVNFPFLEVKDSHRKGAKNFAVPPFAARASRFCHVITKITSLQMIKFVPGAGNQPVRGTLATDERWEFSAAGTKYLYTGQLRSLFAHEITRELGSSGARIGLMESEYLRRKAAADTEF